MSMHRYILPLLPALVMIGCMPEDDPIAPYNRGDIVVSSVEMGSDYRTQIFFDLESNAVVAHQPVTLWDLGFECSEEGYHLILNSGKIMKISDLGPVDFTTPVDPKKLSWRHDTPDGSFDSTAVGVWWEKAPEGARSKGHLYVVDRGVDQAGRQLGYRKLRLEGGEGRSYRISVADLDGSNQRSLTIRKDDRYNFIGFSFNDTVAMQIEPPKEEWDLKFTRYTHIFYEPELTPYSVTGTLINPHNTAVALDTTRTFVEISASEIDGYTFSTDLDAIGYSWKYYNLNAGIYEVLSDINYIVRTSTGFYYKFHFIDFYNGVGEKGVPKFEFRKL